MRNKIQDTLAACELRRVGNMVPFKAGVKAQIDNPGQPDSNGGVYAWVTKDITTEIPSAINYVGMYTRSLAKRMAEHTAGMNSNTPNRGHTNALLVKEVWAQGQAVGIYARPATDPRAEEAGLIKKLKANHVLWNVAGNHALSVSHYAKAKTVKTATDNGVVPLVSATNADAQKENAASHNTDATFFASSVAASIANCKARDRAIVLKKLADQHRVSVILTSGVRPMCRVFYDPRGDRLTVYAAKRDYDQRCRSAVEALRMALNACSDRRWTVQPVRDETIPASWQASVAHGPGPFDYDAFGREVVHAMCGMTIMGGGCSFP